MALLIPSRKAPAHNSFPTSPVEVSAWLEELQPLTSNESKRTLYRGLKHSNRLENNNRNRVEILNLIEPAVDQVLDSLFSQYSDQPLPLPRKPANAHQLASELLHELGFAWKIVVNDTYTSLLTGHTGLRNIALFRAMRVLTKIVLHNALVYKPIPEGVLHDANTLYKLAEESAMQNARLELSDDESDDWSVDQAYAHIQLLSMANLSCQRSRQIPLLSNFLEHSSADLEIRKFSRTAKLPFSSYAVHLEQDVPPARFYNLQPMHRHRLRIFDGSDLNQKIRHAEQVAPDSLSREQESTSLNKRALSVLGEMLDRQNERQEQRAISYTPAVTEVGLKDVFSQIKRGTFHPGNDASNAECWTVVNESRGGACLQWRSGSSSAIQVGELVSIYHISHNGSGEFKLLGNIQWIRNLGRENLLCGIEVVSRELSPVMVEGLTDSTRGSRIECVATEQIVDGVRMRTLLTPPHAYHESGSVRLHGDNGQQSDWIMNEKLKSSGAFDQYAIVRKRLQ